LHLPPNLQRISCKLMRRYAHCPGCLQRFPTKLPGENGELFVKVNSKGSIRLYPSGDSYKPKASGLLMGGLGGGLRLCPEWGEP